MSDPQSKNATAIVGMACVFPGARDVDAYWRNIKAGSDAITRVPANRWDPVYYDPSSNAADRIYCNRGGFIDEFATFDPFAFGVMPIAAENAEPDQLLALRVAKEALNDAAKYGGNQIVPPDRAGVILGRGGYITPALTRLIQHVRTVQEIVGSLRATVPDLTGAQLDQIKIRLQSQVSGFGPDTAIGLVPNLAASRIANRLDFHGPAYTVDAACASSLIAVDQARQALQSGRCDLMLAGGIHLTHDVTFWSVFCQLGAMSRTGMSRPFDVRADGLLIGEGVGIVVLKRLHDAQEAGDRIYAVIRGSGVASDGRDASLMQPSTQGQLRALRQAWQQAQVDPAAPDAVGLIEAHGTATPTGDLAELRTLAEFFGPASPAGSRIGLGSVKSMIGHTMPAAGAAGLIKAALAAFHGVLPPSLNCEQPHPFLQETRMRLLPEAQPWDAQTRRVGVNAFGFGGINAHILLESASPPRGQMRSLSPSQPTQARRARGSAIEPTRILTVATTCVSDMVEMLDTIQIDGAQRMSGNVRLAVLDPDIDRIARAKEIVCQGKPWKGHNGFFFTPNASISAGGKLAFLFPGIDGMFAPRVADLAEWFGQSVPAHAEAKDLEGMGFGVVEVGRLLNSALRDLGVVPDAIAGHSVGEWTGMIASGLLTDREVDAFVASLNPGNLELPGTLFLAAGCSAEQANRNIFGLPDITISNDNCPHQVILCGQEESINSANQRLRNDGVLCQILPFNSGFHSPLFADFLLPHRSHFDQLNLQPATIPLWSATTCSPYPSDLGSIRALAMRHLIEPVRFRELTEALYDAGVRVFVQMGGGRLVGFVDDTLRGRDYLAISANTRQRSGMGQLRHTLAALWSEGVDVDLRRGFHSPTSETVAVESNKGTHTESRAPMKLRLGAPLLQVSGAPHSQRRASGPAGRVPTQVGSPSAPPLPVLPLPTHPLALELAALHQEVAAQQDVVAALASPLFRDPQSTVELPKDDNRTRTIHRTVSVQTVPELLDHCFFPQPDNWPGLADLYPVVPMTLSITWMMEAALAIAPDKVVVQVTEIRANRWLVANPPLEVTITTIEQPNGWVDVAIDDSVSARVRLALRRDEPQLSNLAGLKNQRAPAVTASELYSHRWMFHGPAYHGVTDMGPVGDNGIDGKITIPAGPGGLMDAAGQLLGYWIATTSDVDKLGLPVGIDELTLCGPDPTPGTDLLCHVRIVEVAEHEVRADLDISTANGVWCRMRNWREHRFATDTKMWNVLREPEKELLCHTYEDGYVIYDDRERRVPSRDWLGRRYLSEAERVEMVRRGPRKLRGFLHGRIAAKDAVRHCLWQQQPDAPELIFPVEINIEGGNEGLLTATLPRHAPLHVLVGQDNDVAFAMVVLAPSAGPSNADANADVNADVNVDVDRLLLEKADATLDSSRLTAAERALLPEVHMAQWVQRFLLAKRVVAAGAISQPSAATPLEIEHHRGEAVRIGESWIETRCDRNYVFAWHRR